MNSPFSEVKLRYEGVEYVIPPDRVLMAIARVEEVLTVDELVKYAARGSAPMAKLSMAYGTVLRYAGANVTDSEVYRSMFNINQLNATVAAVNGLLQMMIPPDALNGSAPSGNDQAAAASSSKKPIKQRSRASNSSRRSNSGS